MPCVLGTFQNTAMYQILESDHFMSVGVAHILSRERCGQSSFFSNPPSPFKDCIPSMVY